MTTDTTTAESITIEVGALTFDAWAWGPSDGVPLLALHGFPQHGQSWAQLAVLLAEAGVRTYAFDQRGYSPRARTPLSEYTLDAVTADAMGIADALGLTRFHLAGFGMGAVQAWQVAALHPQRVASLTALRFPHPAVFADAVREDPAQRALWEDLEKMSPPKEAAEMLLRDNATELISFLDASGMEPEVVAATADRLRDRNTMEAAIAWHLIPVERMAHVPPVTTPTLYVFSQGPALLPATALRCGSAVHGPYEMVELEGVGHWQLESAAGDLAPEVIRHLAAHGEAGGAHE
ncbi:alpha/beta hydrolase [Paenarthrobacter sp. NPDC089316]|uniref:alpha/beta fold hydrolase n=1 Tax=unclassified Paenarthrobacter TaxID=2634190 RepID=UPI003420A943